jgi:hypothetical protein
LSVNQLGRLQPSNLPRFLGSKETSFQGLRLFLARSLVSDAVYNEAFCSTTAVIFNDGMNAAADNTVFGGS